MPECKDGSGRKCGRMERFLEEDVFHNLRFAEHLILRAKLSIWNEAYFWEEYCQHHFIQIDGKSVRIIPLDGGKEADLVFAPAEFIDLLEQALKCHRHHPGEE